MSSKRKDSHPSKSSVTTVSVAANAQVNAEKEESSEDSAPYFEMKKESGDDCWNSSAAEYKNGGGSSTSHLSALLSQQNGHNSRAVSPGGLSDGGGGGCGDNGSATGQDDSSSTGAKDDDDDDDDDEEKIEGHDPEKLKAFNMFVRLFVDENLDRHVPISKQPKEKIQAIIDSCTRQFPEHASRGRKRIRTYLKSCRRTKRSREQAGLDSSNARPTPPHLTSVQAEQLLARACENEAENAKRMRMGLEPISQPMPQVFAAASTPVDMLAAAAAAAAAAANSASAAYPMQLSSATAEKQLKTDYKSEQLASLLAAAQHPNNNSNSSHEASKGMSAFSAINGNGSAMYRANFQANPGTFPGTASLLQQANSLQNGPTFDSLKKTSPLLSHKLNPNEIGAVRQLITGYRESAAFLLRSADELEHLLQIQHKL